jgi:hypothetical protein
MSFTLCAVMWELGLNSLGKWAVFQGGADRGANYCTHSGSVTSGGQLEFSRSNTIGGDRQQNKSRWNFKQLTNFYRQILGS